MGNDPLMTADFWSITRGAGDGTLFTFMQDPTTNANAAGIVAKLKASNLSAEGYTLYAYAAIQAWAQAVKRAGSFNAVRVAAANGDNAAPTFVVYRWRGGIVEAAE
jgi:branched-chain amino acid transport system substrate-binding protein